MGIKRRPATELRIAQKNLRGVRTSLEGLRSELRELVALVEALETDLVAAGAAGSGAKRFAKLSEREVEVFRGLVSGKAMADIAALLDISQKTVDSHRARVLRKLGVENNVQLARYAFRYGLAKV